MTQSLFGERQQPNKLIPSAIRAILAGEPVTLQRNGSGGHPGRSYTPANLAEALRILAERPERTRQRVHVGADEVWSVRAVVANLEAALGREARH